jgi:hypothetical protein
MVAQNLHFTLAFIVVIAMGLMTTFEMKLIDFDLEYESKQTLRRIENDYYH